MSSPQRSIHEWMNRVAGDNSTKGLLDSLSSDVAVYCPDMHLEFFDDRGLCETEEDFRSLIARWDRIVCRERRRLSQCELRE